MKIKLVLFIILGVIGISCLTFAGVKIVQFLLADYYLVATLKVNGNKKILIYEPSFQEVTKAFEYEVLDGDNTAVPKCYFYGTSFEAKPKFELLSSNQNNIVGLADISDPNKVLAIHDFSSGESWPVTIGNEAWEAKKKRGLAMLERLQKLFPDKKLYLNDE